MLVPLPLTVVRTFPCPSITTTFVKLPPLKIKNLYRVTKEQNYIWIFGYTFCQIFTLAMKVEHGNAFKLYARLCQIDQAAHNSAHISVKCHSKFPEKEVRLMSFSEFNQLIEFSRKFNESNLIDLKITFTPCITTSRKKQSGAIK